MQPEAELLFCCAGAAVSEAHASRFQALLRADLDWHAVTQHAMQHGVLPLLYWHIDAAGSGSVPKAAVEQLHAYFYANKLHNHRLTQALVDLLNQFDAHDIAAIPFKGPTLAVIAYDNLDLRQFGDLDILVPERDCGAAMQMLLSQGYRLKSEAIDVREEMVKRSRCAYSFIHDMDDMSVDLHWGITAAMEYPYRAFALPLETINVWERLESIALAETSVRSFAPKDLFLILCIHGSKHRWERLSWLCDIAAFIQRYPQMSWERIRANATRLGCRRMLDLGVFLAHELLGVSLPVSELQSVRKDAAVRSLAKIVERELFGDATNDAGIVRRSRFYLHMRERWRDKTKYGALLAALAVRSHGRR